MLTILPLVLTLAVTLAPQQTQTKTTEGNQWGGKSEITTDLQGNVIKEIHKDSKGTVREEKTIDYGPNVGETEENIRSFGEDGRLDQAQQIFTKDKKRVKGTLTKWIYKDANDKQGTRGEEMVIDPDSGNWVRPILAARVQLNQGDKPNEFSVGYNLMHFPGETYKIGIRADYAHAIAETPACNVDVVGAFEFAHPKSTTFVHNIGAFLGGARIGFKTGGTVQPFAEVDAGLIRWGTSNLILQFGGGVAFDRPNAPRWRPVVEFQVMTVFNAGFTSTGFRIGAGVRRRF